MDFIPFSCKTRPLWQRSASEGSDNLWGNPSWQVVWANVIVSGIFELSLFGFSWSHPPPKRYRGTSLIIPPPTVGPCSSPKPRTQGDPMGVGVFYERETLVALSGCRANMAHARQSRPGSGLGSPIWCARVRFRCKVDGFVLETGDVNLRTTSLPGVMASSLGCSSFLFSAFRAPLPHKAGSFLRES